MKVRSPMRYQQFMGSPSSRARYWARSMAGWERVARARPNAAHRAVAELEARGYIVGVITQNVDGLHQAAGTRKVLELHGALARVRCTRCGAPESRDGFQVRLRTLNPERPSSGTEELAPDGDSEVPAEADAGFCVPPCRRCAGVLKPDVVFFGENVPKDRLERCWHLYRSANALLVLGSSLEVFSGRRFVDRAARDGIPVAIVNLGPTRGDGSAHLKLEAGLGRVLSRVTELLSEG